MYGYKLSDPVSVTSFNTKNLSRLKFVHIIRQTSILCHFYILGHATLYLNTMTSGISHSKFNIMHIWMHNSWEKLTPARSTITTMGYWRTLHKFIHRGWRGSIQNNIPTCWGWFFLNGLHQWSGRFLGIIGWDPSVCKSNRSHVDILWFSFVKLGYIL